MQRSTTVIRSACAIIFFAFVACGGGGDDPALTDPPKNADSASTVVGPGGGSVVTPSGVAGVQIPAGVISQSATITITRLPSATAPGQGPLPTSLNQYGPYYQIAISPANAQLGDSVRVGVCQITDPSSALYAPEATHDRLRLAHTVGSTTEILERVGVNDFLKCINVTADNKRQRSTRLGRLLASLTDRAVEFFAPRSLNAAHGGLGGKVKSFSPFGAVDPLTGFVLDAEFGIATTPAPDDLGSPSYDGTNYLVPVTTTNAQGESIIVAQLVSPSGTLVGARIPISTAASEEAVAAFDGTNHLVVYSSLVPNQPLLLGQFVSKTGALVGSSFTIVPAGGNATTDAIAFGAGTYMLVYSRRIDFTLGDFGYRIQTRTISTTGVVGAQLTLNANLTGNGFQSIAFDGTNFLVGYAEPTAVKATFVSPAGVFLSTRIIAPAGDFASFVGVGFNGTNYLVSFTSGNPTADAMARMMSPSGTFVGGTINITNVPNADEFAVGVITSGNNFIVSYIDSLSFGKGSTRARFVSAAGATIGAPIPIAVPRDGRVAIGFLSPFSGTRYFATLLRGVPGAADPGDTEFWTQKDIYGVLFTIPTPPSQ